MLAGAVQGVFRAPDSGPLEAWYVDTSLRLDPDAVIERRLAHGVSAIGLPGDPGHAVDERPGSVPDHEHRGS
jgi:hypothetical protein